MKKAYILALWKKMTEDDTRTIVIATNDSEKALFTIAKDAMIFDDLEIHYIEKYAPIIEYLLRILRKAFGWAEMDRGTKFVENNKCKHNERGFCMKKKTKSADQVYRKYTVVVR